MDDILKSWNDDWKNYFKKVRNDLVFLLPVSMLNILEKIEFIGGHIHHSTAWNIPCMHIKVDDVTFDVEADADGFITVLRFFTKIDFPRVALRYFIQFDSKKYVMELSK
jgi:hypothetical protein